MHLLAGPASEVSEPICVSGSSGSPTQDLGGPIREPGDDVVVERLLDEQTGAGLAAPAAPSWIAYTELGDGVVEIGVGEDEARAFAPELERQTASSSPMQRRMTSVPVLGSTP